MKNTVNLPLKNDITVDSFQKSSVIFNGQQLDCVADFYDISSEDIKLLKKTQRDLDFLSEDLINKKIDMVKYIGTLEDLNRWTTKNNIKISMNHRNMFIASMEAELKLEYQTDKQIADNVRSGKIGVKSEAPQKYYLHVVMWEESERGWGIRPDGCSVHLSEEKALNFIKSQQDALPKGYVPDEYSRPSGNPRLVEVSESLYKYVNSKVEDKSDTWLSVNNPKSLEQFDAGSLSRKMSI